MAGRHSQSKWKLFRITSSSNRSLFMSGAVWVRCELSWENSVLHGAVTVRLARCHICLWVSLTSDVFCGAKQAANLCLCSRQWILNPTGTCTAMAFPPQLKCHWRHRQIRGATSPAPNKSDNHFVHNTKDDPCHWKFLGGKQEGRLRLCCFCWLPKLRITNSCF